jgi:hypothetical protein
MRGVDERLLEGCRELDPLYFSTDPPENKGKYRQVEGEAREWARRWSLEYCIGGLRDPGDAPQGFILSRRGGRDDAGARGWRSYAARGSIPSTAGG